MLTQLRDHHHHSDTLNSAEMAVGRVIPHSSAPRSQSGSRALRIGMAMSMAALATVALLMVAKGANAKGADELVSAGLISQEAVTSSSAAGNPPTVTDKAIDSECPDLMELTRVAHCCPSPRFDATRRV